MSRSQPRADAADRAAEAPSVLIVGGFMTSPFNYWPMRRRLLARGAARVAIAPIWPMDWAAGGLVGFGRVVARTRNTVLRTWRAGQQRPIIVVGHSGGGLVARLATSPVAYEGRRAAVAPAIGALVTLGTPHRFGPADRWPQHHGHRAGRFANRVMPGAFFAPTTGYLTVGSQLVSMPSRDPALAAWRRLGGRLLHEVATALVGEWGPAAAGDGFVPEAAAHLDGARQLTFDDVLHGFMGGPWYGDDAVIDRWWPIALEVWREALAARDSVACDERV